MEVQHRDLIAQYIGGTTSKITKIIKKTECCVLFVKRDIHFMLPLQVKFGKETVETPMANMNNNANRNIKNPIMIFAE